MSLRNISIAFLALCMVGCATAKVDITKTGKGYYEPTRADDIEILKTVPTAAFVELGTITVSGFNTSDVAKMHNSVRAKSAPIGADAVIITDEGLVSNGWGGFNRWATGVAIKFE